ncbi:MAG: hypothetical protein GWO10_05130 [candidate division Zixibacteria bacterium]|nr:hypothetical protein [Gammaproteobacteria bacterium]NIR63166.1 hypothetical protein [candidate division Zixibacteria bacterium]NIX55206.1 hypothetical protein [candidate division Zixibacteria bacterium]
MDPITFPVAYSRLHKKGVVITPMTSLKEIRSNSVVTVNTLSGEEDIIEGVDTVVYASSGDADNALYRELKDEVKEIYRIGQCLSPRQIQHSIWDGARVGRQI